MDSEIPKCLLYHQTKYANTGKTALIFKGKTWSYRDLKWAVERFTGFLLNNGLKKGDRVMLFLPNCPKWVVSCLGTLEAGGVVASLNLRSGDDELIALAKKIKPKFFIALSDFDARNRKLIEVLPTGCKTMIVDLTNDLPPLLSALYLLKNHLNSPLYSEFTWEGAMQSQRHRYYHSDWEDSSDPEIFPDDLAVLQCTGGTTGVPKAAMLTHKSLTSNAEQALSQVGDVVNVNSVIYGGLPFFHVFGLTGCLFIGLMRGATIVLDPKPTAKSMLKLIAKHKINLFLGVPRMFFGMVNSWRFRWTNCDSLELCVSGSDALNSDVKDKFEKGTGCEIIEGYGTSEFSPIISMNPHKRRGKPGSLGLPVPGTDIRIVDEELQARGPQQMLGYFDDPGETANAFTPDGWYKTGDMAHQDGDGFLWFDGRKKDMLKVNGENIYPSGIEKVIAAHPSVEEVAVIGVPDSRTGDRIVACVTLKKGCRATEADLLAHTAAFLERQVLKIPKQIKIMDELPKNFLGKVLKKKLREEFTRKAPV